MKVLKSIEEELGPLGVLFFVGVGEEPSDRREPGLADDIKEGVKGRDWTGVEGLLDEGDCDPDVGKAYCPLVASYV